MNPIERIKNFLYYKRILDENKAELFEKHNIRIDNIYRMYTVYNIEPKEYDTYGGDKPILYSSPELNDLVIGKTKSGAMLNGEDLFKLNIEQKLNRLENYLNKKGLIEMFGITSRPRIDTYNWKVVIEYKFLSTKFWANSGVIVGLTSLSSIIIGTILAIF